MRNLSNLALASLATLVLAATSCDDSGDTSTGGQGSTSVTSVGSTTTSGSPTSTGSTTTSGSPTSSSSGMGGAMGTPLEKAIYGIGGLTALDALDRFEVAASGTMYLADEGAALGDAPVKPGTYTSTLKADTDTQSLRYDFDRSYTPLGASRQYTETMVGQLGAITGNDSVAVPVMNDRAMLSSRVAARQSTTRLLYPELLLKALAANPDLASDGGTKMLDGVEHDILLVKNGALPDLEVWVNGSTGVISKMSTLENSHLHRDQPLEALYADWSLDAGGVKFPKNVDIRLGGQSSLFESRASVTQIASFPASTFQFPASTTPTLDAADFLWGAQSSQFFEQFAGAGLPLDGKQNFLQPSLIASGVYHLRGPAHNSMVVEQASQIVVVEAPLHPARSEALIAWVKTQFPAKPIGAVIVTHHHGDHAGGLREFVAAGVPIYVAAPSATALTATFTAPSTVQPDKQATTPMTPNIIAVSGSFTISDALRPVQILAIPTSHCGDMLIAGVPTAKLWFESDLYSPTSQLNDQALAKELRDFFVMQSIDVSTIAGGHGLTAPFFELNAFAGP